MICTTIQNRSLKEILDILENNSPAVQMAEIRLDRCPLDEEAIEELFSYSDTPLIATCRVAGDGSGTWEEAEARLSCAIEAGAAFADLEIEAPKEMGKRLRRLCNEYGTTMIRSCHFFDGMPPLEELQDTAEKCRRFGGEIIKVVGMARSEEEVLRLQCLYDFVERGRLVAFAMGEYGRVSRLECLRRGAPFTYAALTAEEAAAPGQWPYSEMIQAVYGSWEPFGAHGVRPLNMPASKSFAQRAIIAAALAEGESRLGGYSPCGDTEAALSVARSLGATVAVDGNVIRICRQHSSHLSAGQPLRPGEVHPRFAAAEYRLSRTAAPAADGASVSEGHATIHVGESGLLTRLMIPLVAALHKDGEPVEIMGEGTLLGRPLKGATEMMAQFGTVLRPLAADSETSSSGEPCTDIPARAQTGIKVPLTVQGPLLPGKADISGKDGSQLISGLLMALPLLPTDSVVHVHDPKSIPYMFITVDVLRKFGIRIGSEMEGDEEFMETQDWGCCTGITFKIKGGQKYSPATFDIEGDWSAAANFLVAGAVFGKVQLTGLDTKSLQADISIMDILMEAGASLSSMEDGPEADDSGADPDDVSTTASNAIAGRTVITAQRAPLRAFDTDLNNCPDLFPIVSVLAAFCGGRSNIQGFKRLASKESDRGKAILEMLHKMGVGASAEGDVLTVDGETLESRILGGRLLKGGEYSSSHDHRMAMALTVASLGADGPIQIDDTTCVAKSFPNFFETWEQALS